MHKCTVGQNKTLEDIDVITPQCRSAKVNSSNMTKRNAARFFRKCFRVEGKFRDKRLHAGQVPSIE